MNSLRFHLVKPAVLGISLSIVSSAGFSELQILSLQGESIGENATIESYSTPSLNAYGEIAFAANLEEVDTGDSSRFESVLLYNSTGLHLLAATDQTAIRPGTDGVFEFFDAPTISELGIAMYRAKPRGSRWAENERGIWISWVVNDPEGAYPQTDILARVWDRAIIDYNGNESEEGGKYDFISNPIIVEPLSFAFIGDLYEGPYDGVSGIWYQNARGSETWNIPEPHLLGLTGLPFPGDTLAIDRIEHYAPIDTTGGFTLARIERGSEVDSSNDLGLWRLTLEDNAIRVLQTGDIDGATGAPITAIGAPSANESGQAAIWVELGDESMSEGVYIATETGIQSLVTTNVPVVLGEESLTIESIFNPVINDSGDVAFLATLESENEQNVYGLFRFLNGQSLELVAKSGDQVPGAFEGVLFETISAPRLNNHGQLAFIATLNGEGDSISDTTDSGIWAHDENGDLVLVTREGRTLETPNSGLRTLSGFDVGGYNDDRQLAMKLMFTNGESAIALGQAQPAEPPSIVEDPADTDTFMGEDVVLSVEADGQGPFKYQWYLNGEAIDGASSSTLEIGSPDASDAGEYSVSVRSPVGEVFSSVASLGVLDLPAIPAFVAEPLGFITLVGEEAILDARAVASGPVSYEWYKDGVLIEGATGEILTIGQALYSDEGTYHAVASTSSGSVQSASAEILVTDKRMVNISTRARVGTGANVLIAGFVIGGSEPKTVLIRGVGPGLDQFGLEGTLGNPVLSLFQNGELLAQNSNWTSGNDQSAIEDAAATVGAFSLQAGSDDAAMLVELDPGLYTAIVSGESETTGIALVEVYEVESNFSRLVNISSRAYVGQGNEIVIPGVVVVGDLPTELLIRAVGPSLEELGVSGVLENPVLQVLNANGEVIATNDGWAGSDAIAEASESVGAFPLDPNSQDAGMIISLETGLYTLIITGEDATTGVALVELYALP